MAKTETNILVILDGKVLANCAGPDVALATLEGVMNRVGGTPNFTLTIQKSTTEIQEPKVELTKDVTESKPVVENIDANKESK